MTPPSSGHEPRRPRGVSALSVSSRARAKKKGEPPSRGTRGELAGMITRVFSMTSARVLTFDRVFPMSNPKMS